MMQICAVLCGKASENAVRIQSKCFATAELVVDFVQSAKIIEMLLVSQRAFMKFAFLACTDDSPRCYTWARSGECVKNANFMLSNCRQSCRTCLSLYELSLICQGN